MTANSILVALAATVWLSGCPVYLSHRPRTADRGLFPEPEGHLLGLRRRGVAHDRSGLIVNISLGGADFPAPGLSIYSMRVSGQHADAHAVAWE